MIETKNLSKSFGTKEVLNNVSITFEEGKIIGLLGESGCGKTTLAQLLCGVISPSGGEIFLDGIKIADAKSYNRKIGKTIQIVWQQPYAALDPKQKIGNALWEAECFAHKNKTRAEKKAEILRVFEEMNLDKSVLNALPSAISGGEAQRVALAKCFLLEAKWIVLDEATSMSDVSTQANVLQKVKYLVENNGVSVIFISHDKELAEYFCDKIYFYKNKNFSLENNL